MKNLPAFICILLASITIIESNATLSKLSETIEYDMLVLRQFWPPTSCMFPGDNKCKIPNEVNNWGIHGLWPSYYVPKPGPSYGPSYCNTSNTFKLNLIRSLLPDLKVHWPNLYTDTSIDYLWNHEWEKHGTCALDNENIKSQVDYFSVTLALREEYDFGAILTTNGITPTAADTSYELSDFVNAFQSSLQVEPVLACFVDNSTNMQYLGEMHICMDRMLHLTSCSGPTVVSGYNVVDGKGETPCTSDMPIYYPQRGMNDE